MLTRGQTTSTEEPSTQQAQPALDQTQPVTHQKQTGFSEVFISDEDPAFALKKETLEKQGYRLNSERGSWQLNAAA